MDRKVFKNFSIIIANSQFTADNASMAWGQEVVVCLPGVPQSGVVRAKEMAGRSGIAFFSNLILNKNIYGALGAFDRLFNVYGRRDIVLHLMGRAEDRHVGQFIESRRLQEVVRLHGFVSEAEKAALLSTCRLCLFVPFSEPFGLVTIEAMLHGTPVIGSRSGGPAEVIQDGVTGLLTDPYDPDAIARSILAVYDDVPKLDAMAKAGMELARREYTLARFAADFEDILLRHVGLG
jgi:glycosyltransferase involved in cell wall biosynthesis